MCIRDRYSVESFCFFALTRALSFVFLSWERLFLKYFFFSFWGYHCCQLVTHLAPPKWFIQLLVLWTRVTLSHKFSTFPFVSQFYISYFENFNPLKEVYCSLYLIKHLLKSFIWIMVLFVNRLHCILNHKVIVLIGLQLLLHWL